MKKRKLAIILALILGVSLFSACGKKENNDVKNDDKVSIKIVYPTSRGMGDKSIKSFENWFEKKYPDADLELVSASSTTVTDTVKSELKTGHGPDIFITTEYDTFLDSGLLADVTDMEALTKYRKSSVRDLERENKVYALPLGGGSLIALHYNKTLFDKYGIKEPSESESMLQIIERINTDIKDKKIDIDTISTSMLYPSQSSVVVNSMLSEYNQTSEYMKWALSYKNDDMTFNDKIFQNYLDKVDLLLNGDIDDDGNVVTNAGNAFNDKDYTNTQATAIEDFVNGKALMYIGDVRRCYNTYEDGKYGKDDVCVIGIPIGIKGISYVSYMDDIYMGVNSKYSEYSTAKKDIIKDILNYVSEPENNSQNIFTFTGEYCSVYLEGKSVSTIDDLYFKSVNNCIFNNYIAQEVSNVPFSNIFGKCILAWKKDELGKIVSEGGSDKEKITYILEQYRDKNINLFEKSEQPIAKNDTYMEFESNVVRTQETDIGNQIADMSRSYMGADFALINAGGIRASIPEGDISMQTINSVMPYSNHLVNIKVKGKTLKEAIKNAYNVGPLYKAGKFGEISGLKVKLKTNDAGYKMYKEEMDKLTTADKSEKEIAEKEIIEKICEEDEAALNLEIISILDTDGNEIEDDKVYLVATLDYILQGEDGYTMLGVLRDTNDADKTIEIFDKDGNKLSGKKDEILKNISKNYQTTAECFAEWIKAGNKLDSKVDGRIEIENFIYVE